MNRRGTSAMDNVHREEDDDNTACFIPVELFLQNATSAHTFERETGFQSSLPVWAQPTDTLETSAGCFTPISSPIFPSTFFKQMIWQK